MLIQLNKKKPPEELKINAFFSSSSFLQTEKNLSKMKEEKYLKY